MKFSGWAPALLLLAGCASYDGHTLVPGEVGVAEVTREMGQPSLVLKRPDGDTWLYFPHHPWGRVTYVAIMSPDGLLRGVEQRLNYGDIHKVRKGMRKEDVQALLGPPREVSRLPRQQREVWEYPWRHAVSELRVLYVQFSDDGVAREVIEMHDYNDQPENSRD
jgi:SmpA / OmlA family